MALYHSQSRRHVINEENDSKPVYEVRKPFLCSTQLSMKFQLPKKMVKNYDFHALKFSDIVFFLLINVRMSTIVSMKLKK